MSDEIFTLDTNILVYLVDQRDPIKHRLAQETMRHASLRECVLTHQAPG